MDGGRAGVKIGAGTGRAASRSSSGGIVQSRSEEPGSQGMPSRSLNGCVALADGWSHKWPVKNGVRSLRCLASSAAISSTRSLPGVRTPIFPWEYTCCQVGLVRAARGGRFSSSASRDCQLATWWRSAFLRVHHPLRFHHARFVLRPSTT